MNMTALITFNSYATDDQKASAFNFLANMAATYGWVVEQNGDVNVFWTKQRPCLVADTTAKTVASSDGTDTVTQTYDALSQLTVIMSAVTTNARTGLVLDGIRWSFSANGDIYANKTLVPSASIDKIITARTAAMKTT